MYSWCFGEPANGANALQTAGPGPGTPVARVIGNKQLHELVRDQEKQMKLIKALWNDEQGASMAEYALLMALIAVATIGAITALRNQIITIFNNATSAMASAS